MSKKLIAIASALALSVAGFALPSSAAIETISGGNNANGLAPASAVVVPVPDNNEIAAGNLVTITVKSTQGKTVSATASAGVKLLTATTGSDGAWTSKDGSQTFSAIWSGIDITFYAFTTSTATGTVVVNDGIGNSQTRYIKGSAGAPYNIDVTTPNFVGAGASAQILVKVTDVFGNAIQGLTTDVARKSATVAAEPGSGTTGGDLDAATGNGEAIHASLVGGDAAIDTDAGVAVADGTATGIFQYDNKLKGYVGYLVGRSTDGQIALSVKLNPSVTAVEGLAAPKDTFFKVINSGDQTAQIATLQAQIDTMRPKANSVTKKRYNTLARKWNAAFPSQRVALKK
jgi:plastocyanin